MKKSTGLIVIVTLLTGLAGHLIGSVLPYAWLQTALTLGLPSPITIDLGIVSFVLGFTLNLTLAGALGLIAGLLYMIRR